MAVDRSIENKKFLLDEHLHEKEEIVSSAPEDVQDCYQKLVAKLKEIGINSPKTRTSFLSFWLGVELKNLFSEVLTGDLREGKYYQLVCSTIENLLKFSFNDTVDVAWALSSVLREMAEDSMRSKRQIDNYK